MKHQILALPALLRPALFLAYAAHHSFSPSDDVLAFPQYQVTFAEAYLSETEAQARLFGSEKLGIVPDEVLGFPQSEVEQYRPSEGLGDSSSGQGEEELLLKYEYMVLDGQRYLCKIPLVKKPEQEASVNDTLSRAEEEREVARAADRGWELLSGMQGNCVYFISGWWSYKFCYNEGVRQFHQLPPSRGTPPFPPVEDPGVEGFTLGMYKRVDKDDEEVQESGVDKKAPGPAAGELVWKGESRYLVQRLEGGTKCDLTGRERRIEVQFHCNPQSADRISLIKETSTCAYLMVIQTPRLCNDVAFLPPQKDQPNEISCSPILADDEVEGYESELKELQRIEKEVAAAAASMEAAQIFTGGEDTFQLVGDVILGGHEIVPEDVVLEKSAIVGGGKETYVDTVASSDGHLLSKDDLKKLGLSDPAAVDKLKKELEKLAQGQEWKLDVIDTPRGREYRGIIGTDEKEDDNREKKEGDDQKQGDEGSEEEYYKEEL